MGVVAAWAQQNHKAGLWLVATATRIQQKGETPGSLNTTGQAEQAISAEHGAPVCLTHEMIENYGVILPPSLKGCELYNVQQTADSFKADMSCKGGYNGVGSVESTWKDPDHVVGKIRFVSKTGDTDDSRAMAWVETASAVFKSSDCGNVKPRPMPAAPTPAK